MEDINSVSIIGFIFMAAKGENPLSIAFYTLTCKILIGVVTLQDLYSCFCFLFQTFSQFLTRAFEGCRSISFSGKKENVDLLKLSNNEDVENETLIEGDIEIVMEKVGISWDYSSGNEFQERLGLGGISTLFDEIEPSLEEIKEAFDVFDGNKDGYIDAKDLERILRALGYVEYSELECQRMIMAFSSGEDKLIDFRQFVKVIELSFC